MMKSQTGEATGTFHMENFRRRSRYAADLLTASRAGINMMCLSLIHHTLFSVETLSELCSRSKIFFVFLVSLLDISGKHAVICIQQHQKPNCIKKCAYSASVAEKNRKDDRNKCHPHRKTRKCIYSIASLHKSVKLVSHLSPSFL